MPLPIKHSRVMRVWLSTAARIAAARADGEARASQNVLAKASDSGVADRMVSVRPCLKAAVEALSYVDAAWPCILWCASWNDICSMPSGDSLAFFSAVVVSRSDSITARSVLPTVASKRAFASATIAGICAGSSHESGCGGCVGAAPRSSAMADAASYTSLKKRSTATPSPHACSKLTAALPLAVTMSVKLLSSQRSTPSPWSMHLFTASGPTGDSRSRLSVKRAESIVSSAA
mmetsp:Transcript_15633/g.33438  ORF Transcript_15633/g.33438 Transcript_15633/m.33438 type:complete len:233 (+) Transcript_15633:689-1387(+)